MTTLVTADDKGRLCIKGTTKGHKYLVKSAEGGWWVTPMPDVQPGRPVHRNRREWPGRKDGRTLWNHVERMGKLGLRIEEYHRGKLPVPPCRF